MKKTKLKSKSHAIWSWNCYGWVDSVKLVCLYIEMSRELRLKSLDWFWPIWHIISSQSLFAAIISITIDFLDQIILLGVEGGCLVHCRSLLNPPVFHLLDAVASTQLWSKYVSRYYQVSWEKVGKIWLKTTDLNALYALSHWILTIILWSKQVLFPSTV